MSQARAGALWKPRPLTKGRSSTSQARLVAGRQLASTLRLRLGGCVAKNSGSSWVAMSSVTPPFINRGRRDAAAYLVGAATRARSTSHFAQRATGRTYRTRSRHTRRDGIRGRCGGTRRMT